MVSELFQRSMTNSRRRTRCKYVTRWIFSNTQNCAWNAPLGTDCLHWKQNQWRCRSTLFSMYSCQSYTVIRRCYSMLEFPATQVKAGNEIVGVRDMCDVCFSNDNVAYEALRVRGPVHDFESKAFAIDIKCTCTNPKCPALIKEAEKKAKSTGLLITDVIRHRLRLHLHQLRRQWLQWTEAARALTCHH